MKGKKALLSVYNKEGIVEFAKELEKLDYDIISSGGTARVLREAGVEVIEVSELVKARFSALGKMINIKEDKIQELSEYFGKAILNHRVATLIPEVHAGLLARYAWDKEEMDRLLFDYIDLVCIDLYPLQDEIANPDSSKGSVIEQTDIGGPTMLRSAAKGRRIVICDPADRMRVIEWIKNGCPEEDEMVDFLAAKAEKIVAEYCLASAKYHSLGMYEGFIGEDIISCQYGENGWQTPAKLYSRNSKDPLALDKFKVIEGSTLSYNNMTDLDRFLQTITHIAAIFDVNRGTVPKIAVGGKHGNACGAAIGNNAGEVIRKTLSGDLRAIFGGFVITNFLIGEREAESLAYDFMPEGKRRILDGVIAPHFDPEAIEVLSRKGGKCRLIENEALLDLNKESLDSEMRFRYVRGGFLAQRNYNLVIDLNDPEIQKFGSINTDQEDDILLARAICETSNSNTVTLVLDGKLIGNGVGQQDRVGGCKLAVDRAQGAKNDTLRSVAASDSFFPFVDGPELLAENGIIAIFATSGSVNDEKVIKFCEETKIALYLITDKKGRCFFGH